MSSNIKSLYKAHELLGNEYNIENNRLYRVTPANIRIEIIGTENSIGQHHFNIFAIENGKVVAESLGVALDNLLKEVNELFQMYRG